MNDKIKQMLTKIYQTITDRGNRIEALEQTVAAMANRITALEKSLEDGSHLDGKSPNGMNIDGGTF